MRLKAPLLVTSTLSRGCTDEPRADRWAEVLPSAKPAKIPLGMVDRRTNDSQARAHFCVRWLRPQNTDAPMQLLCSPGTGLCVLSSPHSWWKMYARAEPHWRSCEGIALSFFCLSWTNHAKVSLRLTGLRSLVCRPFKPRWLPGEEMIGNVGALRFCLLFARLPKNSV